MRKKLFTVIFLLWTILEATLIAIYFFMDKIGPASAHFVLFCLTFGMLISLVRKSRYSIEDAGQQEQTASQSKSWSQEQNESHLSAMVTKDPVDRMDAGLGPYSDSYD